MGKARDAAETVIGPEHNGMRMTPEEFDAALDWEEGYVYELVDGILVVSPPPSIRERGPNDILGHWLWAYHDQHPEGSALDATVSEQYMRTLRSRRRADHVIWAGLGRKPQARVDVPRIVIEFVSPGRRSWNRDYVEKRDEYLDLGVGEYWIINRFQRTMTVFSRIGGKLVERVLRESDTHRTPLLPGFELSFGRMLQCVEQWEEE